VKLLNWINKHFCRTKLSFWIVYTLSKLLSFLYVLWTKRTAKLPHCKLLRDVEFAMGRLTWSEDSFFILNFKLWHFWMRSAEEVQWHLENRTLLQTDCDEFATYAARALEWVEEVITPMVLTVRWVSPDGDAGGHNMAIYSYLTQNGLRLYGYIGNWGHFRGFSSVIKIVESVSDTVGCQPIAYALATPGLKLIAHEKL